MADSQSLAGTRQERRKASKARLEKRRRERINQSFTELKNLLILANPYKVCEKSAPYSSKRKAEMLEKLVIYLRSLQTECYSEDNPIPESLPTNSFNIGYRKCMTEVAQFLSKNKLDESPEFMTHLFCHLNRRLQEIGNSDNRDESGKETAGDLDSISRISQIQSKAMTQTVQTLVQHDSSKTPELNPNSISALQFQLPVKSATIGPGFFSGGYYFWPVYNTNENTSDSVGHHSRTAIDNTENYSHLRIRIIQTQNQVATSSQRKAHCEHERPGCLKQPLNDKMWRPWSRS
ncbi:transcription factor HES-4-B-like [Limulus polyphemus]|uniref:Transcription factor HES-4-B-like n=1 Tax=Limulus polyphemus TaxID=6850 RepID=A0ABM1BD76_LIMPO|nr:transcription factor HES-4-B-like [Limulus polyphemus]